MKKFLGLLSAFALCLSSHLNAQEFRLDWFALSGGGGSSFTAEFELSSLIGQPDVGAMAGGEFALIGGFWTMIAAADEAFLSVSLAEGTVTIAWLASGSEGFELEETGALTSPWSPVNSPPQLVNGTNVVRVPHTPGSHFYRLRKP